MEKQLIGGSKRSDVASSDPRPQGSQVGVHRIPPGFKAQWMLDSEVRERRYGDSFTHPLTGVTKDIKGWQPAQRDMGIEASGGNAADAQGAVDTTIRKGPHILMIIDEASHRVLEERQEAHADVMEHAFSNGSVDAADVPIGEEHSMKIRSQKVIAAHPSRATVEQQTIRNAP